ncbi:MAG: hypothetical protein LBC09_06435 [Helicobacteraceae bacterium]|jgi:hypothetical protein|nr:hypothetical protein [Helicobacteraceae bacterium]
MQADISIKTVDEKIEIGLKKRKFIALFLMALLLAVIGAVIAFNPPPQKDTPLIRAIGAFATIFFGYTAIVAGIKILDKKSGFIIDDDGITDNSGAMSVGRVLWENIVDIEPISVKYGLVTENYIIIIVNNPEAYINKQKNPFSRRMAKANYRAYDSPIAVYAGGLKCRFDDLFIVLNARFTKRRSPRALTK